MTCVVRSFPGCQRPKRHEGMRQRMEAGPGRGNDRRPELASVSGAMPYAPGRRCGAVFCNNRSCARPSARACLSVRRSVPIVAALGYRFGAGAESGRALDPKGANSRPSFRRAPTARRTPSCGSTPQRASTITRGPAITDTPAGASICARLTRAQLDIAPRAAVNVRPFGIRLRRALTGLACC
jgi:hypothetical protein